VQVRAQLLNPAHCLPRHLLAFVLRAVAVYGQFLLATGVYGYYMSGYVAKAKHGAFMGMGGDVAVSPIPAAPTQFVLTCTLTLKPISCVWLCATMFWHVHAAHRPVHVFPQGKASACTLSFVS